VLTYRADHVGSLLRPASLLEARESWQAGRLPLEQLRAIENRSILDALELQRQAGIAVFSDGEFRRAHWGHGLLQSLQGVVSMPAPDEARGRWQGPTASLAAATHPTREYARARLTVAESFTRVEARFLKQHAPGPFKVTLPSPSMFHRLYHPVWTRPIYDSPESLVDDLVTIYLRELDELHRIGTPYIQLDSLRYGEIIEAAQQGRLDPPTAQRTLEHLVAVDNRLLARARAASVTRAVHFCRGNHRSAWVISGGYESIAEMLFGAVDTDRFLLEYDTERAGGFEPLRFVPHGKMVVLGLISTKSGALESIDDLCRRVDEASRYVALEYLAISPQCGFASTQLGNLLDQDQQRAKLALVAEVARKIWN